MRNKLTEMISLVETFISLIIQNNSIPTVIDNSNKYKLMFFLNCFIFIKQTSYKIDFLSGIYHDYIHELLQEIVREITTKIDWR